MDVMGVGYDNIATSAMLLLGLALAKHGSEKLVDQVRAALAAGAAPMLHAKLLPEGGAEVELFVGGAPGGSPFKIEVCAGHGKYMVGDSLPQAMMRR
jgi:hypothetical protein